MDRHALKEEVFQSVINAIDIEQTLQNTSKEVQKRGKIAIREFQAQQRDRHEELSRQVQQHLEQQKALRDETQRLRGVTQELARWLAPEIAASLNAVVQEPAAAAPAAAGTTVPGGQYTVILRKADAVGVGLEVSRQRGGLLIERLEPSGLVEAWNRRCAAEADAGRAICAGDLIVRINEAQTVEGMLKEFETQWILRLRLTRGKAPPQVAPAPAPPATPLRCDAPEFLPERLPLQARQLPVIHEDADSSAAASDDDCGKSTSGNKGPLGPLNIPNKTTSPKQARKRSDALDKENMAAPRAA